MRNRATLRAENRYINGADAWYNSRENRLLGLYLYFAAKILADTFANTEYDIIFHFAGFC